LKLSVLLMDLGGENFTLKDSDEMLSPG
jgi:hypothetical protein